MPNTPYQAALDRIRQAAESGAKYLNLSGLGLTALPPEIVQLTSLTELSLSSNQLTSLLPEIGQLTSLKKLTIGNSQLASLPPEIGKLTNLKKLNLENNQLASLAPEIGQLTKLTQLDLRGNQLVNLPPEIVQLTGLIQLDLGNNQLASLPPEIGQLTSLTQLGLGNNQLASLLPEIGQLTNLTQLDLGNNQLASLPLEIVQLTGLTQLDLRSNQLANLPPEISQLTSLTRLNLGNNQLASLPLEIVQLTGLTQLDLRSNHLASLPPEISQLTCLTQLDLGNNQLASLPPEIIRLTRLAQLDLRGNQLVSLPPEIGQLTSLTQLDLQINQLTNLSPKIGKLTSLTVLNLFGNRLTRLPPEFGQLTRLTRLNLGYNQLTSLPPEIGQLTSLKQLDLQINQLTNLSPEIGKLTSLTVFNLVGNRLTRLPPEFGQLTRLTRLNLGYNQLTSLPPEFVKLHKLDKIVLWGNPLEIAIPAKLLGPAFQESDKAQEILDHYKRIYEEGGRELGEARVLVVGEGGVGKTSLVKRLIDNTFDNKEDTTLIVEKRPLPLGDVRAQVWDFGGQEHMHATHQFFFSGRSLYLLVFDTRQSLEQSKVEYWLTLINAYSQNAPVILVGNKCDQHEMDIAKRTLREKYPNIRAIIGTSASTGEHIEELRQKIQEEVRAMPQVRVLFSADYLAVKDEMETLHAAHISHEEFVKVCKKHHVRATKDQDTLLDLLHDLGTVLYFRDKDDNPLLPALGVLNPNWVTRGVYLIVTHPALKDKHKGRLTMSLLREILSAPEYSRHCEDIAKLLERFELCYRADDSAYWLPSLMEKDEPAALGDFTTSGLTSAMKFEYWYPELPKSVIVRFIVKAHKMILNNQAWRYGVVLKLDGNTALVRADERDKRISIFIVGEESTRRDALAILRAHFDDIHAMFAAPPEAFIYPPQYPDLRLPFVDMKTLAKTEREHKAVYQGKPVTINLRELLDGFVTPQEHRKDEEREEKELGRRGDTYITNFNVGGNMDSSNVAIGKGHQITRTISPAFPADLQAALVKFIQDYQSELEKLDDPEQKEELQEELDTLKKDVAKKQPNKERIKVTVEGLKKAAENIKGITLPVLETAAKVILFLKALP